MTHNELITLAPGSVFEFNKDGNAWSTCTLLKILANCETADGLKISIQFKDGNITRGVTTFSGDKRIRSCPSHTQ